MAKPMPIPIDSTIYVQTFMFSGSKLTEIEGEVTKLLEDTQILFAISNSFQLLDISLALQIHLEKRNMEKIILTVTLNWCVCVDVHDTRLCLYANCC